MTPSQVLDPFTASRPIHDPQRPKLRDRYRHLDASALERRTRKFRTLSPEFAPQPVPLEDQPLPAVPRFPAWCRGTQQSPCRPFESGPNTLPGMERWQD